MSPSADHTSNQARAGGCRCGAVRYRAVGTPIWVAHCHCVDCRKSAGAAFVTWAAFKVDTFVWEQGAAKIFASSPGVERSFCGTCGTPLTFTGTRWPGELHVQVATLDAPESLEPRAHVNMAQALSWIHLADGLRRYARTNAEGPPLPPRLGEA